MLSSDPAAEPTTNFMTWPVVARSAGSKSVPGSPPPNGSSGPSLMRNSSVPGLTLLKSTMTSLRSATWTSSRSWRTTLGRNPPSLPIWKNGMAGFAGRGAVGLVTILSM